MELCSVLYSLWWITSTVFPLVAGAFGPLANLASVCALVQTWRVYVPPGASEIHGDRVADPAWLLGINAVSLVMAVIANIFILMTFAQRIRYRVSLPFTITLWYISSILLIGLVIAATKLLQEDAGKSFAFSQSYYYGIMAAVLYFIIATLLFTNYFNSTIKRRYPPSFRVLTIPQRTLMLQTTSLMFYLGLGALVFSKLESWEYVDTIYWADYTLLTVGLGSDYPLQQTASKIILIPYAVGGIIVLGLVVSSVRGMVLERGKIKMNRRAIQKQREKWLKELEAKKKDNDTRSANELIKEDFEIMRKIERAAESKGKWMALVTSSMAFLLVWLGGAMVFTFSERTQHWTYFDSLFFSYTSLLTIGYGDYYPQSNSGKPFFVIWSVIAVPTMTILISNMSDTVVRGVRDGTLWIGQKTVLPDAKNPTPSEQREQTDNAIEQVRDGIPCSPKQVQESIAAQIRVISGHLGFEPPKRYTFDEWIEFLELLELRWESEGWSWLSEDGPLMSGLTETQWVLGELCRKLEKALSA
ncbi:voltage-gated potassium channel [Morchella conica CCBAS932]|uniref:Voltage-gated potassium channel n=1 Tax=Morchella conica CCBAS932 TaxID=1392247 RepID=A0A3N4KW34_9PEZI|nr:voltage-gated potassium channel [Morchella conica CCBAS932]